ncbi:MAG: hypothetical protein ACRESZ_07060 [Methylococcales bacterium]
MNKIRFATKLLVIGIFMFSFASLARAQASRTWVSGVGDDANPCSRTAPCKTFAGAISKTAALGEINCIDPGGFGAVTITKSITIACDYTEAGVLVSGTNGIVVNTAASDIVTLKGLDFEGLSTGLNGITFIAGGTLHVHKVQIRGFRNGGSGINFAPNTGSAELYVADSYITDNGNSGTTAGILIRPSSAANAFVSINRTQLENNSAGIRADSSATSGIVRGTVRDSVVSGSTFNGISAISSSTASSLMVDNCSVAGNAFGLVVNGTNASLFSTHTTVTGNTTGLFVNGSGKLFTYNTNAVDNNTTDGTFTNVIVPE